LQDLDFLLNISKPGILCVTETWFRPSSSNNSIHNSGYSLFRKDRHENREGGGVCIFTNNERISASQVFLPAKFISLELVVIDVFLSASDTTFRLFVCYRPPCQTGYCLEAVTYTSLLCECIQSLWPANSTALLCGDFNFSSIKWDNSQNILNNSNTASGIFLDFFYANALTQFVTRPTRVDGISRNGSILDLVFCNDENFVRNVTVTAPFSSSDHCSVEFDIIHDVNVAQADSSSYDFSKADWVSIAAFLDNVDFFNLFDSCVDISSVVNNFYSVIYDAFNRFVPLRSSHKSYCRSRYPYKIRRLFGKKSTAWKQYRTFRTQELFAKYKLSVSQCRSAIRAHHVDVENNVINSDNINKFYRYANRKFSTKSRIGPLKSTNGQLLIDPNQKAELLQTIFASMFTTDNGHIPALSTPAVTNTSLSNVLFSPVLVKRAIRKLKAKSKGGPDGLPPIFIKTCSDQLSAPLAYVYSQCMEFSYLPPDWLRAYITPVFKKGDPSCPLNFRPIALTCTVCKIMEVIIKDQLLSYLLRHNLISKHQHGFLSKHSTTTNLLEATHDWLVSFTSSCNVDVIYIDFSRAFDSIVFNKLLAKLEHYGITGKLLMFVSAFVHNRVQCVVLDNCFSSVTNVLSGVPQGSVLGPVLFLIFINDVSSTCIGQAQLKLFADDVKLYSSFNVDVLNCGDLQQSLDNLSSWAKSWQLTINISKCSVLSIHHKTKSIIPHSYFINGFQLINSSSVNDLGILVDSRLTFNLHISNILSKATQRVGVFFRGFSSRHPALMKKAFITYIRPTLEFNSNIWNPTKKYFIDKLENIQRRFTKRVHSLSHLSYLDRLKALKLEPLELRRLKFDLIQYFKVLNNFTCIVPNSYFHLHYPPPASRNPAPFLQKSSNFNKCLQSSFFFRFLDCWNGLPINVQQSSSLTSFKRQINLINFNSYLKGSATEFD
jgi:hypothetical protein